MDIFRQHIRSYTYDICRSFYAGRQPSDSYRWVEKRQGHSPGFYPAHWDRRSHRAGPWAAHSYLSPAWNFNRPRFIVFRTLHDCQIDLFSSNALTRVIVIISGTTFTPETISAAASLAQQSSPQLPGWNAEYGSRCFQSWKGTLHMIKPVLQYDNSMADVKPELTVLVPEANREIAADF